MRTPPIGQNGKIYSDFIPIEPKEEQIDEEAKERAELLQSLEDLSSQNSDERLRHGTWDKLFNKSFIVGEWHCDINPKRFLMENMELLRSKGFTTIFFEHLPQDVTEDLELYRSNEGKNTPVLLKEYLNESTSGHLDPLYQQCTGANKEYLEKYEELTEKYNYNTLVRKAASLDIRVIPLEISYENYSGFPRGQERMTYLNYNAVKLITRELEIDPEMKYCGLVGASHILRKYDVPGICEALAVQDLIIVDQRTSDLEKTVYDHNNPFPDKGERLPKKSTMGLVLDITDNIDYQQGIMPLYNNLSSTQNPYTVFRTLRNPERPLKKSKNNNENGTLIR